MDVGALITAAARRGAEELVAPVRFADRAPADTAHGSTRRGQSGGRSHFMHLRSASLAMPSQAKAEKRFLSRELTRKKKKEEEKLQKDRVAALST